VGGLVGANGGGLTNTTAVGDVNGSRSVGGLAGGSRGNITGATASGDVDGSRRVGGLVGAHVGNLTDATASGDVNGTRFVGGLVGTDGGGVTDGTASGDVNGSRDVGGLVGYNFDGTVRDSYATGNVSGNDTAGGLVGWNVEAAVNSSYATGNVNGSNEVGGLVGNNFDGTVYKSYATGDISGSGSVGGLVGSNTKVTGTVKLSSSYATGNVSGTSDVGGLVGYNSGKVRESYATGNTSGERDVGGLVGSNTGTVTDGYWDVNTTGRKTSAGSPDANGLTTAKMIGTDAKTNMTGFDFTNTWETVTDGSSPASGFADLGYDSYPILKGLKAEPQIPILVQFNLNFADTYYNGSEFSGSNFFISNESAILLNDTNEVVDEVELRLNVTEVGNGTDVKEEVFNSLTVNPRGVFSTEVIDGGKKRAEFDEAFSQIDVSRFRDGLYVELFGGIDANATAGEYDVTFEMLDGNESIATDNQTISINKPNDRKASFNLEFADTYYNGSEFSGSNFFISNESAILLNDTDEVVDEVELRLNVTEVGNGTDVKEEVFDELVVNPRGVFSTEVIEGGERRAEFDEAFSQIDVSRFRDGLYVELFGSVDANATAGEYDVTFEMLEGGETIATDTQSIRINESANRDASFNLDFAEGSPYKRGSNFFISNESAILLNDTNKVVDEVELRLNVTEVGNGTDVKEEVFDELVVNPRGVFSTEVIEGGKKRAEFDEAFSQIDVSRFRDGLEVELLGEIGDREVSTGDYNITLTLLAEGVEVENGTVFEAGTEASRTATADSDAVGIDTTVLREEETTSFEIENEAGETEPLIDDFESAPRNIPEDEGGLDDDLMEDLAGDGDVADVSETVAVFGRLIRGNDLGLTDEQARALDWSDSSPENEVTVADMVALFGEQIRAD
jgi:hypothetical protein